MAKRKVGALTEKEEALYRQYLKDMEELKGEFASPPRSREAWVKTYREQQEKLKAKGQPVG